MATNKEWEIMERVNNAEDKKAEIEKIKSEGIDLSQGEPGSPGFRAANPDLYPKRNLKPEPGPVKTKNMKPEPGAPNYKKGGIVKGSPLSNQFNLKYN